MSPEAENKKQLENYFKQEYNSMKAYIDSRIKASTNWDAEDILQDVAAKLFSMIERRSPIQNIGGFVYRSIKNKIIDLRRKKSINATNEDLESRLFEALEIDTDLADGYSEEIKLELEQAIKKLKPHYHDIIIAVDFEGYTYKEISNETGIPEGTLMSHRHRALGKLADELTNKK